MLRSIVITTAGQLDGLERLWSSLREHYETLEARPGEIYERAESWRRRRAAYVEMLEEGGAIVGIERDGELVAYAAVHSTSASAVFTWSESVTMIETFVVDDRHRGEGLGSKLLAAVRALARERGDDELQLMVLPGNHSAIDFYRGAGFGVYCLVLSDALPHDGKI